MSVIYIHSSLLLTLASHYKPAVRSQVWYDNLNSLPALLSSSASVLPPSVLSLVYSWEFSKTPCPVNSKKNGEEWTAKERLKASEAKVVHSIDELNMEVCIYFINESLLYLFVSTRSIRDH